MNHRRPDALDEDDPLVARLRRLDGWPTAAGPLRVAAVRPGRFREERDAVVAVGAGDAPAIELKYFAGRPADAVPSWIEASLPDDDEAFVAELVAALAALLPPGGYLMVVYGDDETGRGLKQGVPPAATPLGRALYVAGCAWFKDWYFAEGGREGEAKLQGNLPPDEEARRRELDELRAELRAWLERAPVAGEGLLQRARERARAVLANAEEAR
jgi:hypothetical protein